MDLLFYNGTIVTGNERNEIISNGFIVVANGIITKISTGIPDFTRFQNTEKINLHNKWVMPGLVNTHGHTGMTLLRGYGDDLPLQEWLQTKMWPMESKFTKETVQKASSLAILEMVKTGTTTFLDMYIHMDTVAELVKDIGVRAVLTRGIIGLCSEKEQTEKLYDARQFVQTWNLQAEGRITTMLSPHSSYTCPPEFIEQIVAQAMDLNVPLHTHMSETINEVEENIANYNKRPVEHLAELGFFEGPALVAHAVHVTDEEIAYLAKKNVAVSHNPASNLKLGSGIAPIPDMINRGIIVSLGTDSAASNNNLDMFQEMRLSALIHKGVMKDATAITAPEALRMATINGAKSLQLSHIGSLEEGKDADFITIDSSQPHLQPRGDQQVISHIVYSASGSDVNDVYVKGSCIVKNKECVTIDEEKVVFEASKHFEQLLK